jgi:hypothetical protein
VQTRIVCSDNRFWHNYNSLSTPDAPRNNNDEEEEEDDEQLPVDLETDEKMSIESEWLKLDVYVVLCNVIIDYPFLRILLGRF